MKVHIELIESFYRTFDPFYERRPVLSIEVVPDWMAGLEEEDVAFVRKFLLASGSLKEVASLYGVTYPTVRLRLDRLIQKIRIGEENAGEPYISLIKRLAVNEKLDVDTARVLIAEYKKAKEKNP